MSGSNFFGDQITRGRLRFLQVPDASIELHLIDGARDFSDAGRRPKTHLKEMSSHQERRGWAHFNGQFARTSDEPFLRFGSEPLFARHPFGIAAKRIGPRNTIEQIKLAAAGKSAKRAFANLCLFFIELARLQVIPSVFDRLFF